ncbi:MAG: GerMN domain-containing protein [Clostridia bacterium]|nr:GerMN domain-containing protein [Clostridia bacterium]
MKGKIFLCVIIIALLIFSIFILMQNNTEEEIIEYTPEEEISEEQTRKTLVTLYFLNKETNDLMPEARLVDAKILVNNPYESLVNLLLEGPKNDKLQSVIPAKTKLNKAYLEGNTAVVDLSTDFIKDINLGAEAESKIVYSIVNTLVELTEIDSVKILIDGKEGCAFYDKAINFKSAFVRI